MPPVASKPRLTISKIVKHNKLNRYSSNFTSIDFFILKIKASSHRSTTWQFTEKRAHLLGFKLSSEACKPCMRAPRLMPWWSIRPLDQDEQTLARSGCERDQRGLAVVAYGKIGGIALGYGSGLVFLHGGNPDSDKDGHEPSTAARSTCACEQYQQAAGTSPSHLGR